MSKEDLTPQQRIVYNTFVSFKAAQRSGEGPAINYQGEKLGAQMRAYYMDMSDLEDIVAIATLGVQ